MEKLLIDIIGAGLGVFSTLLLFDNFWVKKNIKLWLYVSGLILNISVGVVLTIFLQNAIILPILIAILKFMLSFFFKSGFMYKVLLTLLIAAIALISEVFLEFVFVYLLSITIVQIQASILLYMIAVLTSSLFLLFSVLIARVIMKGRKQSGDWQFNLLMAFMPMQSMLLCYVILVDTLRDEVLDASLVRVIAILLSII